MQLVSGYPWVDHGTGLEIKQACGCHDPCVACILARCWRMLQQCCWQRGRAGTHRVANAVIDAGGRGQTSHEGVVHDAGKQVAGGVGRGTTHV